MLKKYIKRVLLGLVSSCFLFASTLYGAQEIKIIFNEKELALNTPAVIENGTTLVPLRSVFEAFGVVPEWDGKTQTITAQKDDTVIWLQINNNVAKVGDKEVQLNVPAKTVNGYTLVPLRFISESFGVVPKWDGSTRTITIHSNEAEETKVDTPTETTTTSTDQDEDKTHKDSDKGSKESIFNLMDLL